MLDKIKKTIKLTTDIYLEKHLLKIPEDKKQIAINAYNNDIERIAKYILNSWFFEESFLLTEDFIKWLHKKFYPENFMQKWTSEDWKEIILMIPWEYKKIDNFAKTDDKSKYFSDLPWWSIEKDQYTKVEFVEKEMNRLIKNFNKEYYEDNDLNKRKDLVFLFIFDFIWIHPFSDWNWRIAGIILDLYLEKLWFSWIWLKTIVWKDKLAWDRTIFLVRDQRNPKYMYDFIEKIGGTI